MIQRPVTAVSAREGVDESGAVPSQPATASQPASTGDLADTTVDAAEVNKQGNGQRRSLEVNRQGSLCQQSLCVCLTTPA